MILLANTLIAIAGVLNSILYMLLFLIIARVVISWVNADPYNFLVRIIVSTTDPLLVPVRRKLPVNMVGLDFTPIVVMLVIYVIQMVVVQSLFDYGVQLKAPVVQGLPLGL